MAAAKTWFVQTGFGTILGPMPEDALREMVRTGALVRSDQVREGEEGEWCLASETPGLFNGTSEVSDAQSSAPTIADAAAIAPESVESRSPESDLADGPNSGSVPMGSVSEPVSQESASPLPPMAASSTSSIKGRLVPPPVPRASVRAVTSPVSTEQVKPIEPSVVAAPSSVALDSMPPLKSGGANVAVDSPRDESPAAETAPPEDDLITRWRLERDRSREELGTVSLAAEMTESSEEKDFAPELPSDLLDDEDLIKPTPAPVSVLLEEKSQRPAIHRPAFLDQVTGLEEGPRVREETAQQKWDRWRRSLPSWQIAAGVVVVLFAAWWFWPRSSQGIYDRYVAIWEEWKIRRADLKDSAGWERFLKQTEKELNSTVPYLEKHARASDREKQLLLFVGRDCLQKMLAKPRMIGSPREKQLQVLLAILHEMYEPSGRGQHLEAIIGSNGPPSRKADRKRTNADAVDPNVLRLPKDGELPPPARPKALPDEKLLQR